jgi:hypothetical protein
MRCFLFLLGFVFLASCSHQPTEYVENSELVQQQRIELIPIFNATEQETPWNVSEELTQLMSEMRGNPAAFVVNETERWMNFDEAYQGVQQDFGVADFAVVVNLIQHSIIPAQQQISCSSVLVMKARLVIVDLRQTYPQVVFDQIVGSAHSIPNKYTYWNYSKNTPGSFHYEETPLSQAHIRLATVLMEKIQEYAK